MDLRLKFQNAPIWGRSVEGIPGGADLDRTATPAGHRGTGAAGSAAAVRAGNESPALGHTQRRPAAVAGIPCLDIDSQATVKHGLKPWVDKAHALPIAAGVWQLPGRRGESDLGGQRLIEAPDGLILIEAHAGLSFESEWAAIKAIGLDPMRVKYVLAPHEHGDHAPGAYQ